MEGDGGGAKEGGKEGKGIKGIEEEDRRESVTVASRKRIVLCSLRFSGVHIHCYDVSRLMLCRSKPNVHQHFRNLLVYSFTEDGLALTFADLAQ